MAWRRLGNPRLVCAPLVDQSERAWRLLCREYGAELACTPMLNARLMASFAELSTCIIVVSLFSSIAVVSQRSQD